MREQLIAIIAQLSNVNYTWVDISPVEIINKQKDPAGRWFCYVIMSDGSNIRVKFGGQATDADIMAKAQNFCDGVNGQNTKEKMIALLRDIRQIAADKIVVLQTPPEG
jgi:hypothetical protein